MKTLKLIAMLFMASVLSMGFVSCGDDDDDETEYYNNNSSNNSDSDDDSKSEDPKDEDTDNENNNNNNDNDNDNSSPSILKGTKWSGTVDGEYVEMTFNADGTLIENFAGEITRTSYIELDGYLIFGDGSVASNTFGENPVLFEVNASKTTLKIIGWETWTLSRKL